MKAIRGAIAMGGSGDAPNKTTGLVKQTAAVGANLLRIPEMGASGCGFYPEELDCSESPDIAGKQQSVIFAHAMRDVENRLR